MFDIQKLIKLYKTDLDGGRIYLYENMGLFLTQKNLTIKGKNFDAEHNDYRGDLFLKLDEWLQINKQMFDPTMNSKQWMGLLKKEALRRLMDIRKKYVGEQLKFNHYVLNDSELDLEGEHYGQDLQYVNFIDDFDKKYKLDIIKEKILELPDSEMRLMALLLDEYRYNQVDIARLTNRNFRDISKTYQSALEHLKEKLQGYKNPG